MLPVAGISPAQWNPEILDLEELNGMKTSCAVAVLRHEGLGAKILEMLLPCGIPDKSVGVRELFLSCAQTAVAQVALRCRFAYTLQCSVTLAINLPLCVRDP